MQDTEATRITSVPVDERIGGGQAKALDLLVDGGVLLDEGVGLRDVGLGLVVIEVADEILDRVVRQEQFLEFRAQLRGQGLVVGNDQGGPTIAGDHIGHGEGFA